MTPFTKVLYLSSVDLTLLSKNPTGSLWTCTALFSSLPPCYIHMVLPKTLGICLGVSMTNIHLWCFYAVNVQAIYIRESVDSLCRDGADTDTPIYQMKRLIAPERYSYKPFQTYNMALRVFLYHIRPSKYVKYAYTMTYRNCHTSVFEIFFIIFFFFFFKRSTSKLTNALTFILA